MANRLGARRGSSEESYFCDDLIVEGSGENSWQWQCTCPPPCECTAAVTGPHWGKPCARCLLACDNSDVWLLASQPAQVQRIGTISEIVGFVSHLYCYLVWSVFDIGVETVHRLLQQPWNIVVLIAALV